MASSNKNSNTAAILTVLTIAAVTALLILAFYDVFSGEMRTGKYMDPNVAGTTVEGTLYDRNERVLAMEVPVYDVYINLDGIDNTQLDLLSQTLSFYSSLNQAQILNKCNKSETMRVYITSYEDESYYKRMLSEVTSYALSSYIYTEKSSKRLYPAQFHLSQLLLETEEAFDDILNPRPGYDEQITYGADITLTADLDIQYFADLVVQKVFSLQNPEKVVLFIMNMDTGEILSLSTYPFYNLNNLSSVDMTDYAYLTQFEYEGKTYTPSLILKAGNLSAEEASSYFRSLHKDCEEVKALFDSASEKDSSSLVVELNGPVNSYLVFIGSVNSAQNQGKEALREALKIIEDGLLSQSKI